MAEAELDFGDLSPAVVGMLVLALLNDLWATTHDAPCDPQECGPCSAIMALVRAGQLDRAVLHAEGLSGAAWWVDGKVDRQWLMGAWGLSGKGLD